MKVIGWFFSICSVLMTAPLVQPLLYGFAPKSAEVLAASDSAKIILQRYASAWRGREEMVLDHEIAVAFWIKGEGGGEYHVALSDKPSPTVADGVPEDFDIGFETDIELLRRLERGQINALTAMGKARESDVTPLSWKLGKAFAARPGADLLFRRLCFFFWTRDWPPIVRFGDGLTREVHGANAVLLLYEDRFRSAWYQLRPGMHVFPGGQKASFAILLICTRGHASAKFDGKLRLISEGEAVFIPPGMSAEYWAEPNQYAEVVWIALGQGA
jgi:hypothetical protein